MNVAQTLIKEPLTESQLVDIIVNNSCELDAIVLVELHDIIYSDGVDALNDIVEHKILGDNDAVLTCISYSLPMSSQLLADVAALRMSETLLPLRVTAVVEPFDNVSEFDWDTCEQQFHRVTVRCNVTYQTVDRLTGNSLYVTSDEFDAAPALDLFELSELPLKASDITSGALNNGENIFTVAVNAGMVREWDGPFVVDICDDESYRNYLIERYSAENVPLPRQLMED